MAIPDLCNEALQTIGTKTSIASIDEVSNEARQCRVLFARTRQKLIRSAPWEFCKAAATLALLKAMPGTPENPTAPVVANWQASYPPPGWLYSYARPTDCLMVRYLCQNEIVGNSINPPLFSSPTQVMIPVNLAPVRFTRGVDRDAEGNQVSIIATNARNALIVYNADVEDDTLWDGDFREAFIFALGSGLAGALSGDKAIARELLQITQKNIMEARVAAANEGLTTYDTLSSGIASRDNLFNISFGEQYVVP